MHAEAEHRTQPQVIVRQASRAKQQQQQRDFGGRRAGGFGGSPARLRQQAEENKHGSVQLNIAIVGGGEVFVDFFFSLQIRIFSPCCGDLTSGLI